MDDVYQRRLQRLCMWIAETEEDGRLLEETAVAEEEAAQRRDQGVTDDLGAISLVEARSRDLFDRARVEHITNVARMHDEVVPLFGQRQQAYEDESIESGTISTHSPARPWANTSPPSCTWAR